MNVEQFGKRIIEELLKGEGDSFRILRKQIRSSRIKKVEHTGSGFFVHYSINPKIEKIKIKNIELSGTCKINNDKNLYDLILFIRNGVIDFLEGVIFGEGEFPREVRSFEFEPSNDNFDKFIKNNNEMEDK
jgi:hypothetical protein